MTMKTREQIDTEHNTNTQDIRASYHDRQEISHEDYHIQLNTENERYEAELIAEGYLSPPSLPRDFGVEIDAIKVDIKDIKEKLLK